MRYFIHLSCFVYNSDNARKFWSTSVRSENSQERVHIRRNFQLIFIVIPKCLHTSPTDTTVGEAHITIEIEIGEDEARIIMAKKESRNDIVSWNRASRPSGASRQGYIKRGRDHGNHIDPTTNHHTSLINLTSLIRAIETTRNITDHRHLDEDHRRRPRPLRELLKLNQSWSWLLANQSTK